MMHAPAESIRVVVSHGDPLLQAGLIVGASRHADFTVLEDRAALFDVFVSDYPTAVHALSSRSPGRRHADPAVVVVAHTARESEVREAMSLGALGFVTADCSFDELAMAVRSARVAPPPPTTSR